MAVVFPHIAGIIVSVDFSPMLKIAPLKFYPCKW